MKLLPQGGLLILVGVCKFVLGTRQTSIIIRTAAVDSMEQNSLLLISIIPKYYWQYMQLCGKSSAAYLWLSTIAILYYELINETTAASMHL